MAVTIGNCYELLEEMCQLMEKSFGPNALQVMICTQTGQLMVTSDGMTILRSIHPSHPTLRFILASVTSHHSFTGDGAKTFILTLHDILGKMKELELPDASDMHYNEMRIKLAAALHHIQYHVIPHWIIPNILNYVTQVEITTSKKAKIIAETRCLIHTAISSKESKIKASKLADLTTDLIFKSSPSVENLRETLEMLTDHFDYFCIDKPGGHVLDSVIIPGILIDRNFVTTVPTEIENVSYVILDCDFDIGNSTDTTDAIFQIKSELNLRMALTWKEQLMKRVLCNLKRENVDVLLYTGKVCDTMKQLCNRYGIAVVQYLQKEDVDFITTVTGISAIHDLRDIVDDMTGFNKTTESHQSTDYPPHKDIAYEQVKFIGTAQIIKMLTIGGKQYINLVPCLIHPSKFLPHTLVLYGPTQGISKQYSTIVAGGMKTVQMWLQNIDHTVTGAEFPCDFPPIKSHQNSRNFGGCQTLSNKCKTTPESQANAVGCQSTLIDCVTSGIVRENYNQSKCNLKYTVKQTLAPSINNQCSFPQNEAVEISQLTLEESLKVYSLPGGGTFEFLVHHYLLDYIAQSDSHNEASHLKHGCQIVADGILCVPRVLHRNSYSIKDSKNTFIKLQHLVMGSIGGNNLVSMDGKSGEIKQTSVDNTQVKESLYSKIHLLNNILTSVQQLLKIDRVVSVKSVRPEFGFINQQSDSESENNSD